MSRALKARWQHDWATWFYTHWTQSISPQIWYNLKNQDNPPPPHPFYFFKPAPTEQTPLLGERFGDGSILLFWALTSRSGDYDSAELRSKQQHMMLFSPSQCWNLAHQQQSFPPLRKSSYSPSLTLLLSHSPPPPTPLALWSQQPSAVHLWHIKTPERPVKTVTSLWYPQSSLVIWIPRGGRQQLPNSDKCWSTKTHLGHTAN